jgi:hypothetical protein
MIRKLLPLFYLACASAALAILPDRFSLVDSQYKVARELPPTFFNPFKSQANGPGGRKETASITNEMIADALSKRGISGIVLSADARAERVVLGDEVFGVGDELAFPAPKQPVPVALVAGSTVLLTVIRAENLEFEVRVDGEPSRRLTFPLHAFWVR